MPCVWLSVTAQDELRREATSTTPKESGGILAGYHGEHDTVVITHVIGPGPKAIHGHDYFIPDHEFHQEEITRVYEESGRFSTYLGDWHSHPNGGNGISKTDRRTLRRIANSPAARVERPLMLIISGADPWQITIHRAIRTRWRFRFVQLEMCTKKSRQGERGQ